MKGYFLRASLLAALLLSHAGDAGKLSRLPLFRALSGRWKGAATMQMVGTGEIERWSYDDTGFFSKDEKTLIVESVTTAKGRISRCRWQYRFDESSKLIGILESAGTVRVFDVQLEADGMEFTLTQRSGPVPEYHQHAAGRLKGTTLTETVHIYAPDGSDYATVKSVGTKMEN